ncbi:hypothetical protein FDO65_00165 [Nakamurella flava]|uniref:OmpR/PhoB-type domain-containing protein n=1 Tax=Nakamurella flava TaxID=2576308 RepID=A0A4U6QIJ5_9ACTN|nr:BTAD domain-containing putative transcriptional regulator [Nakamurella flava]TKV60190.1 hypothetical protein FDO65_00165 [Nakamurella flava]
MRIADLGALTVWRGEPGSGAPADVGGPKPRALLGVLALLGGRPISAERLAGTVWPDRSPAAALPSLQTYVAKLRQILEPGRAARTPATVLVTSPAGYALHLPTDSIDSRRFATGVPAVHAQLTRPTSGLPTLPPGISGTVAGELRARLTELLDLWRDTPFLDVPDDDRVIAERARLEGLRLVAVEDLALLRMAAGENGPVADALLPLLPDHPVREPLWALTALALARAGRQGDALDTIRRIRRALADELGIDPGPGLQDVETAVLRQDERLHWQLAMPITVSTRPPVDAVAAPPDRTDDTAHDWPLVGRDPELAELDVVLRRATSGRTTAALIVGEAGIGKTRLIDALTTRARVAGMTVVTATCSADSGAPPLWPWRRLLSQLDTATTADGLSPNPLPDLDVVTPFLDDDPADEGTRFRWWEAVVVRLREAAGTTPLVVVLDDLHWADPSTLSLLQHVVDRCRTARLAVVLGRRPVPDPAPPLAVLGESLARHDALRLDLAGLRPPDIEALLRATSPGLEETPVKRSADDLWARTKGNAFFVTELIRLSRQGGATGDIPTSVGDVVRSRLQQLPAPSRETTLAAAVVGQRFDALLLSAVTGQEPDVVLEAMEPAVTAGLIAEIDAARYAFAHALVRDAVVSSLPLTRRSRHHAAVAKALEEGHTLDPATARSEAVRHWIAAGPLYAGRAWRAAAAVAADAAALRAWDEAAALLRDATLAAATDPLATDQQRYDLHMQRADVCRWRADQDGLDEALLAAYDTAAARGDVERAARAAIGTIEAAVWLPRVFDTVEPRIVDALRHCLRELPSRESELGCRVMLALASELYYADAPQERAALVEQGLAVARRLDEPDLLVWAMTAAFQATWRPGTREERFGLAREAVAAAERTGEARHLAIARYLLAAAAGETGRIDVMWEQIRRGREVCQAHSLTSPLVALGWLEAPWLALQGDVARAWELTAASAQLMEMTSMPHKATAPASTALVLQMITDDIRPETVDAFAAMAEHSHLPMHTTLLWMLVRTGRRDEADLHLRTRGVPRPKDTWMRSSLDAQIAEIAAALGDVDLAAGVYGRLAEQAGTPAAAGASSAMGPIDTYLAVAAATTGERAVAARHADDAQRLCEQWAIPLAAQRLADFRSRYGF